MPDPKPPLSAWSRSCATDCGRQPQLRSQGARRNAPATRSGHIRASTAPNCMGKLWGNAGSCSREDFRLRTASVDASAHSSLIEPPSRATVLRLPRSVTVRRSAENIAVAEHGDRTVLTDGDNCGKGVVIAVAPTRRVPSTSEGVDGLFGSDARNEPHAEEAQHSVGVEDSGAIDLGKGVAKRCQVRGLANPQGRRRGEPLLNE